MWCDGACGTCLDRPRSGAGFFPESDAAAAPTPTATLAASDDIIVNVVGDGAIGYEGAQLEWLCAAGDALRDATASADAETVAYWSGAFDEWRSSKAAAFALVNPNDYEPSESDCRGLAGYGPVPIVTP